MKKYVTRMLLVLCITFTVLPAQSATAAPIGILSVISAGVKKVIKAIDLKIQRLQNKTIWLQNAQKVLENALSKLKLDEIADWTAKQKEQYRKYYDELAQVKAIIAYYQRIRDITEKQADLVSEYSHTWGLLQGDDRFTAQELDYMARVYAGIMEKSVENLDQIILIVESFSTEMTDARRLDLINKAADRIDKNYNDLRRFNRQNILLALQRAKTAGEIQAVKNLYGLP